MLWSNLHSARAWRRGSNRGDGRVSELTLVTQSCLYVQTMSSKCKHFVMHAVAKESKERFGVRALAQAPREDGSASDDMEENAIRQAK